MNAPAGTEPDASRPEAATLRALHEARVAAELAEADRTCPGSDGVASQGPAFAEVALVKGLRGPAEESGGAAMSGADGDALDRALTALGFDPARSFRTVSRPEPGADASRCARRLRLQIEAVDPEVVIALDGCAAEDLAHAFEVAELEPGVAADILGRQLLAVDGFEASLGEERRKRVIWTQLKAVARPIGDSASE